MTAKQSGSGYNPTIKVKISVDPSTHLVEGVNNLKAGQAMALLKALKANFPKQFYDIAEHGNEADIDPMLIAAKIKDISIKVGEAQAGRYKKALDMCDEAGLKTGNKNYRQQIKHNIFHNVSYDIKNSTRVVNIDGVLPKSWSIDNAKHYQFALHFSLDPEKNAGRWNGQEAASNNQKEGFFKDGVDYFDYNQSGLSSISPDLRKNYIPNQHHLLKLVSFVGGKDNQYSGKILQELCNIDDRIWSSASQNHVRFVKIGNQPCAFAIQVDDQGALVFDRIFQTERCAIRLFVDK